MVHAFYPPLERKREREKERERERERKREKGKREAITFLFIIRPTLAFSILITLFYHHV